MKKVLIVLACIALVLPLFALSAFAEDSYNARLYNYLGGNVTITFTLEDSSTTSLVISSGWGYYNIPSGVVGVSCGRVIYNSQNQPISTDSSNPFSLTLIDGYYIFSVAQTLSSSTYYYYIPVPDPPPDPLAPVNDGVTTFIGYGGQVLSFLTNNSTLLFLIGLSVGLCLVIPFGVSKIKDLLKGY